MRNFSLIFFLSVLLIIPLIPLSARGFTPSDYISCESDLVWTSFTGDREDSTQSQMLRTQLADGTIVRITGESDNISSIEITNPDGSSSIAENTEGNVRTTTWDTNTNYLGQQEERSWENILNRLFCQTDKNSGTTVKDGELSYISSDIFSYLSNSELSYPFKKNVY